MISGKDLGPKRLLALVRPQPLGGKEQLTTTLTLKALPFLLKAEVSPVPAGFQVVAGKDLRPKIKAYRHW